MPLQDYTINTRDALAGQLYGLQQSSASIISKTAEEAVGFAIGMTQGTADRGAIIGLPTFTDADVVKLLGVTLRQVNREQEVKAGDGTVLFAVNSQLPLLRRGQMNVVCVDGCSVGDAVHMNKVTGTFYGAAGVGLVEIANAQYRSTGSAGDIVVLEISEGLFKPEVIA